MSNPHGSAAPAITTQSVIRLNLGWWRPDRTAPVSDAIAIRGLIGSVKAPLSVVNTASGIGVAVGGETRLGVPNPGPEYLPLFATLPPITPDMLGDPAFQRTFPSFREQIFWRRELDELEHQIVRVQEAAE